MKQRSVLKTPRAPRYWLVCLASLCLVLASCTDPGSSGSSQGSDTVTLKPSDFWPKTHYAIQNGAMPFMKKAEELSGGSINFEYYPSEQLAAAKDQLRAAKTGLTDIASFASLYAANEVPLLTVCSLPWVVQHGYGGKQVVYGY